MTVAATCTGAYDCAADQHVHGCLADYGRCDSPAEHKAAVDRMFTDDIEELVAELELPGGYSHMGEMPCPPDSIARAWELIEACSYKDADDGTCHHPDNPTPECHEGACPYAR